MQYQYIPNNNKPLIPLDKQAQQKKFIRFFSNRIGSAFLFGQIAVFIISLIFTFWLMLFFGVEKAATFIQDDYALLIEQIVLSTLLFVPPFLIVKNTLGVYSKGLLRFKIRQKKYSALLFLTALGFTAISNILTDIIATIFAAFGLSPMNFSLAIPNSVEGAVLFTFTLSVVPAVIEEFALRVMTLGSLRNIGDKNALIISSILFALMHSNFIQIPFALLMGLILGYLTLVTGSIIPAVLLHFINNFASSVISLINQFVGYNTAIIAQWIYYGSFLLLGLLGYALLKKNYEKPFLPLKNDNLDLPAATVIKTYFFTSPTTIIVCVYFLGCAFYELFR